MAEKVSCMEEKRNASEVLVGKHEVKRTLARPRHGWQDNIKIYLQEIGGGAWIGLIWLRIGTNGILS
jgi:hypothetical protein